MIDTIDPIRDVRREPEPEPQPRSHRSRDHRSRRSRFPNHSPIRSRSRFPLHNPILRRPRPQDEGAGRRVGMHTAFAVRTVLGRRSTCFLTCVSGCPRCAIAGPGSSNPRGTPRVAG